MAWAFFGEKMISVKDIYVMLEKQYSELNMEVSQRAHSADVHCMWNMANSFAFTNAERKSPHFKNILYIKIGGMLKDNLCLIENSIKNLKEPGEKTMENVEITMKVNGREVDLSTISTETFENVKKAIEVKEIPVVRIGSLCGNNNRIIIRLDKVSTVYNSPDVIVLDKSTGDCTNYWDAGNDAREMRVYKNVHSL